MKITIVDLDKIKYAKAYEIQEKKFKELIQNKINEQSNIDAHFLFLCQHYPVITIGKTGNENNILLSKEFLQQKNIDFFASNRGGDVTFHGLGQIVGYPILDLDLICTDLKLYMRKLEQIIIDTIAIFNLVGYRIENVTGVWVNSKIDNQPKKIAALGVKTSRWITMHGFALNVHTDLDYFKFINPCGITDKGVTSLENELKNSNIVINYNNVKAVIIENFLQEFGLQKK